MKVDGVVELTCTLAIRSPDPDKAKKDWSAVCPLFISEQQNHKVCLYSTAEIQESIQSATKDWFGVVVWTDGMIRRSRWMMEAKSGV